MNHRNRLQVNRWKIRTPINHRHGMQRASSTALKGGSGKAISAAGISPWRLFPVKPFQEALREGSDSWMHQICSRELASGGCPQILVTPQATAKLPSAAQLFRVENRKETPAPNEGAFLQGGIFPLGHSASINEGRN